MIHSLRSRYAAVTLVVLALCLAPVGLPKESELQQRIFDSLHIPLFAAVVVALSYRRSATPAAIGGITLLVLSGATAIEFIQPSFGRSASKVDLHNGVFGAMLGGAWMVFAHSRKLRAFVAVCALLTFVGSLQPAYAEYRLVRWRLEKLPTVADFEDDIGVQLWRATGGAAMRVSAKHTRRGARSLLVETEPGTWSGVGMNLGTSDWSGYKALVLDMFNDSADSFTLGVRIDDARSNPGYDERFNFSVLLNPGWNTIEIAGEAIASGPKNGRLDMEAIRRMVLFVSPDEPSRRFFVDDISLTNELPLAPEK